MKPEKSITFYAYLDREDGSTHGACLHSPVFRSEPALVSWIREHRLVDDRVHAIRREVDGSVVSDFPLVAQENVPADPERVRALVEELKTMIDAKKKQLDKGYSRSKPAPRPAKTMDPLETRALTYFEVYDEEGNPRFPVNPDGKSA